MPLLVLLAALGALFGFANVLWQFPAAIIGLPLGLGWIAVRAHTPGRAFRWGWLAAGLAHLAVFYWIALPIKQYGGLPWALAGPCPPLVAAITSSYFALWCAAVHYTARRLPPWAVCLGAGVFWFVAEHLGSFLFTGFPWVVLSTALAPWPWAVQSASLVGAYGLSGILAALATAIVLVNTGRSPRVIAVCLILFLGLFGPIRLLLLDRSVQPGDENAADVLLVQGSVDQGMKWDDAYQAETVRQYQKLTRDVLAVEPVERKTDLILWPETAMPFYLQDITPHSTAVLNFARETGTWLMSGAPAYAMGDTPTRFTLFNRAFLISPQGRIVDGYDKEHLVPFGEYVPLKDILPLGKLVQSAGDYSPGQPGPALEANGMRLGLLICYEAIFPNLAQHRVEAGAGLLVNISNDAWFGRTAAPLQHLAHARLRCVEQGRFMARCTNNGITVCIDSLGRVIGSIPQYDPGALACRVATSDLKTVFNRCYHILIPAMYFLALLFLVTARLWPNRRQQGS